MPTHALRFWNSPKFSQTRLSDIIEPSQNSFAVLRLALAIAVLVSHSYWFTTGTNISEPLKAISGFSLGEHAVQVFFFLSGLLVAHSLERNGSLTNFAAGRALRIFPGLVACVLSTALLGGLLVTALPASGYLPHPDLWGYIAKTALLITASAPLPGVFEDVPVPGLVNGSLWTLKYEVVCYGALAAFAGIGLLAPSRRRLAILALAALIVGCEVALPDGVARYSQIENFAYFAIPFALGVLASMMREHLPVSGIAAAALLALAIGTFDTPVKGLTTTAFLGYASLWLATFRYGPLRAFANRTDLSFGVYIYATPIQQALVQILPGIGAVALTLAALPLALAAATLSWTLVEKPAMGLRRALFARLDRGLARRRHQKPNAWPRRRRAHTSTIG